MKGYSKSSQFWLRRWNGFFFRWNFLQSGEPLSIFTFDWISLSKILSSFTKLLTTSFIKKYPYSCFWLSVVLFIPLTFLALYWPVSIFLGLSLLSYSKLPNYLLLFTFHTSSQLFRMDLLRHDIHILKFLVFYADVCLFQQLRIHSFFFTILDQW